MMKNMGIPLIIGATVAAIPIGLRVEGLETFIILLGILGLAMTVADK